MNENNYEEVGDCIIKEICGNVGVEFSDKAWEPLWAAFCELPPDSPLPDTKDEDKAFTLLPIDCSSFSVDAQDAEFLTWLQGISKQEAKKILDNWQSKEPKER